MDNRLRYTGMVAREFTVNCTLSVDGDGAARFFSFYVAKNGVVQPDSRVETKILGSGDIRSVPLIANVELAPNDYVEIWTEQNTGGLIDLIAVRMNVTIS